MTNLSNITNEAAKTNESLKDALTKLKRAFKEYWNPISSIFKELNTDCARHLSISMKVSRIVTPVAITLIAFSLAVLYIASTSPSFIQDYPTIYNAASFIMKITEKVLSDTVNAVKIIKEFCITNM